MIKRLWDDESLRRNITVEAYRTIEKENDSERYVKNLLGIYKSLC